MKDEYEPMLNDTENQHLKEEQKADIRKFIKNRMEHLREDVHSMLNNFNLEIIRQFEV